MSARTIVPNDGLDSYSKRVKDLTDEYKDNAQADPHRNNEIVDGKDVCFKCLHGGTLLCCCGKRCQRRYHISCVDPPLTFIPPGIWHCIRCVKKKIKLGLHSVSEGVESILDSREVLVSKDEVMRKEYFVKYQGLAHAHNCWIPEKQVLLEAPKLLAKFKEKQQVIKWKKDWSIPHRLLLKRKLTLSKQSHQPFDGNDDNDSICRYQWLVKWAGLGYDHVTWELDNASFMTSSKGMKLKDNYECRRKRTDVLSNSFEANEERKASFAELSLLTCGASPGFYNQHLSYVNKLRMCWHKGQSALIVDDKIDQERIWKVILFLLSLNCNVKRPFLIISTSTGLPAWKTEFLHLAPSANLVVYKGNKDVRSSIRALEFFNEDGGILFEILLSSSDIIVEDLHALKSISWEAIIIDECQRYRILGHLDSIKILTSEMRLLIVSGQIKEDQAHYIKLLSFLKPGHHELNITNLKSCPSASISNLKSQLEEYVAFKCNSDSIKFVEYWVPAQLSSLQLEQYCSMLLSNSLSLCSGQKSDSVSALRDLVISTRKCCNHPFLLDQSLQNFVIRGRPVEEHLDIGMKASGKLQLLEKILFDARSRGLRVIILFQSSDGPGSIGDILDDVLFRRFGEDCYVRYGRGYIPSKKQAALDTFNDRESGKFVFLMENRACLPSIKLSSVDTVILFDSDWDPQNDIRCLQKMSISSQLKQLTVLRLYSSFTVEEKILMLAKEGIALDSNMQLINQSASYHTLLKWGASLLFSKLDDLHGSGSSGFAADISDRSILNDVMCELSSKMVCGSIDTDCHGQSFILRVQPNGRGYVGNVLLLGEREMKKLGNEPPTFSWSDLLKGRNPRWIFLSVSSQRTRKTAKTNGHILKNDSIIRKRSRESEDNVDPKGRKVTKDNVDPKRRKVSKDTVGANMRKLSKGVVDPKTMKVSKDIDAKRREVSKLRRGEVSKDKKKKLKKKKKKKKNRSAANRESKLNGAAVINKQFAKLNKLPDTPKSTNLLSKAGISGLCDILHFSENAKVVTMRILEHIFEQYSVNCLEVSTVQAFKISVCWIAASLLKHKIDRKDSLDLAKLHLNFGCTEEEATDVYFELRKYEKDFSGFLQNGLCVEKSNIIGATSSLTPELKDMVEEKQKGFQDPHVLNLEKSPPNELDLPRDSPTTVLSSQGQTYIEMFHSEPNMTHEVCPSQKTHASLPVEADATSMDSDADERINGMDSDADERINGMDSVAAEVSFEHWNEVPNSSNEPNNVDPITGSLERHGLIISTEIAQSDGIVSEDPPTLMNEVFGNVNMSTHPPLPNSVETDAVACDSVAVLEVRQWYNIASPVCGESTTSEFAESILQYTQPSNADLMPLPQVSLSAIPSFMKDLSSTVMPLDRFVCCSGQDNCYTHEVEEILQAPTDLVEPINSSFVLPVTLQHSTYVPINERATQVPHDITNPGYMSSDLFQAHSVTSEMPQVAYPDPLLIEMARIEKMNEEAFKIRKEKILQLQSEYKKEFELLKEKHCMLLQNANTAVALKKKELERRCKLVLMNMQLAQAWVQMPDSC